MTYFENQTIFLDKKDYRIYKERKNEFMQFLERDERRALKFEKFFESIEQPLNTQERSSSDITDSLFDLSNQ